MKDHYNPVDKEPFRLRKCYLVQLHTE